MNLPGVFMFTEVLNSQSVSRLSQAIRGNFELRKTLETMAPGAGLL